MSRVPSLVSLPRRASHLLGMHSASRASCSDEHDLRLSGREARVTASWARSCLASIACTQGFATHARASRALTRTRKRDVLVLCPTFVERVDAVAVRVVLQLAFASRPARNQHVLSSCAAGARRRSRERSTCQVTGRRCVLTAVRAAHAGRAVQLAPARCAAETRRPRAARRYPSSLRDGTQPLESFALRARQLRLHGVREQRRNLHSRPRLCPGTSNDRRAALTRLGVFCL